jgi:hypothetical protein
MRGLLTHPWSQNVMPCCKVFNYSAVLRSGGFSLDLYYLPPETLNVKEGSR